MDIETKSGCRIINKKIALEELGKSVYHFWIDFQLLNSEEFIFDADLICKELGCSKSTLYAGIKTLVEKRYVEKRKLEGKTKYVNLKVLMTDFEIILATNLIEINENFKVLIGNFNSFREEFKVKSDITENQLEKIIKLLEKSKIKNSK